VNTRPTWDEVRMEMARQIAQRSLCDRAKVGAIITGPDGRHIVGEGYNGPPAGFRHSLQPCNIWCQRPSSTSPSPDYSDCVTLHAEANALMKSDYTARCGGTIYITSHPCWGCAKLIANSGLSRVVVESDAAHGHRDPMASYRFLLECGLVVDLPGDVLMMVRLTGKQKEEDVLTRSAH
jgi:dCMP deaminase